MARDLSYLYSSQPSSSQSNGNEAVGRAFWQSTPTALEQLRQRTDDGCHQARAYFQLRSLRPSVFLLRSCSSSPRCPRQTRGPLVFFNAAVEAHPPNMDFFTYEIRRRGQWRNANLFASFTTSKS